MSRSCSWLAGTASRVVITFAAGKNTATMNGQMAPGGRDLYYVQAKAGQTMNVSLSSAAPLTFQVYDFEIACRAAR